jgi:hypothetical protein
VKDLVTSPLGDWRVGLVWRLYGWALLQSAVHITVDASWGDILSEYPPSVALFALTGIVLLAFGARLPGLLLASGSSVIMLWECVRGLHPKTSFPAEELALYPALAVACLLGVAVVATSQRGGIASPGFREESSRVQLAVFRTCIVVTLSFAGLAKLNSDFFNEAVSCIVLTQRLDAFWELAAYLPTQLSPSGVVALELGVPFLLCVLPRLGILLAFVLTFSIGHVGPTAFNGIVIAMALAFLRADDGPPIARWLRRGWPLLLLATLLLLLGSNHIYQADVYPWHVFALFQVVLPALACVAGLALWRDAGELVRGAAATQLWSTLREQARPELPRNRSARSLVLAFALVLVLNGLTPYLGIKYRFSQAMLSNLRVDMERWNSHIVPRWLYLPDHDPFVHVSSSVLERWPNLQETYEGIPVGLLRPDELRRRAEWHRTRDLDFRIEFSYLGEKFRFDRALDDSGFWAAIERMEDTLLFQAALNSGEPQTCVH